jgi:hypothetical protein
LGTVKKINNWRKVDNDTQKNDVGLFAEGYINEILAIFKGYPQYPVVPFGIHHLVQIGPVIPGTTFLSQGLSPFSLQMLKISISIYIS